jgi:hypothetical protein
MFGRIRTKLWKSKDTEGANPNWLISQVKDRGTAIVLLLCLYFLTRKYILNYNVPKRHEELF